MSVRDNFFQNTQELEPIRTMSSTEFERFTGELFQRMGYQVYYTRNTGDEGVDILIRLRDNTAVVQCKNLRGTVSQSTIRDLYGAMIDKRVKEAYLVTTGMISKPARAWVDKDNKPIHLVDGLALLNWTRQYNKPQQGHQTLTSDNKEWQMYCPKCKWWRIIWAEKVFDATRQVGDPDGGFYHTGRGRYRKSQFKRFRLATGKVVQGICPSCYSKVETFYPDPKPEKKGWLGRLLGRD